MVAVIFQLKIEPHESPDPGIWLITFKLRSWCSAMNLDLESNVEV